MVGLTGTRLTMTIISMWRTVYASLLVVTLLTGCASTSASTKPRVVVAAYPYEFLVEHVAGSIVDVSDLTTPGAEPHDIELTPHQLADLSDADLVVVESGFQPAVDQALEQMATGPVLDVSHTVPMTAGDPHLWLDPVRMVAVAEAIAAQLAHLLPAHAAAFQANADRLVRQLRRLDHAYATGLASCTRRTFVTSHAAFGYLAARYGLQMVPIAGLDPQLEPSPARQAAIADTVRREGVTTIFTESLASPAVAQSVADETGARLATLDPIEGLTDATSDQTYLTLMRANLTALERANGCT